MLTNFIKIFLYLAVCFTLVFSPIALAQDASGAQQITTLSKGDPAPFSGTLFSTEASAILLTKIELSEESCQVKLNRAVGLRSAELQLKIDTVTASLTACNQRYTDIVDIKNDHILFLDNQIAKRSAPKNELWLAAGVILGVALGVTSAWSYGQVANP